MKKLFALCCLASLLLCGCKPAPAPTVATVTDALACREGAYCYHIPALQIDGQPARSFNDSLYARLDQLLQEGVYDSLSQEGFAQYTHMLYTWGQKATAVSIAVQVSLDANDLADYYVYSVDCRDMHPLSAEEIYALYGMDAQQGNEALCRALNLYWDAFRQQLQPEDTEYLAFVRQLQEKTLSAENLSACIPFVGGDGALCFVATVYAVAGAESYDYILDLEGNATRLTCTAQSH